MGYFTWTLANRKLTFSYGSEYSAKSKLQYGSEAWLQCPDGTAIHESCYEGYGIFDGKDAYGLVAEWNRPYVDRVLPILPEATGTCDIMITQLYEAWGKNDEAWFDALLSQARENFPSLKNADMTEIKRLIGIRLACGNHCRSLPCPIKITSVAKPRKKYVDLPASLPCQ